MANVIRLAKAETNVINDIIKEIEEAGNDLEQMKKILGERFMTVIMIAKQNNYSNLISCLSSLKNDLEEIHGKINHLKLKSHIKVIIGWLQGFVLGYEEYLKLTIKDPNRVFNIDKKLIQSMSNAKNQITVDIEGLESKLKDIGTRLRDTA